jgi:threonine dehydrogenase-like Zn-dependent dehydrogenase
MLAQAARREGASPVVLVDVGEPKVEAARALGFEHVVDAAGADPVAAIRGITSGGADVSVEGVGLPRTFAQAAGAARKQGRVVLLGNMRGDVALAESQFSDLLRRELTLIGTWNSRVRPPGDNDWTRALGLMAEGHLQVEPLITHRLAPERTVEAFEMIRAGEEFCNKVMLVLE